MVTQPFSIYRRALPQKLCQFHQKFRIELQQILKSEKNHELGEFLEISYLTFQYNSLFKNSADICKWIKK